MKNIHLFMFLCLTSLCISNSFAHYWTTMHFLNWPIDPVTVGTGSSNSADGAGIFSIHQNPAFINQTKNWDISFQNRGFSDMNLPDWKYYSVAGTWRINYKNTIGLFLKHHERPVPSDPYWSQENNTLQDLAIGLIYGRQFSKHVNAGLTLKYLKSDFFDVTANSWAFDLGLNIRNLLPKLTTELSGENPPQVLPYILPDDSRGINLGITLLNAGPAITYIDEG